MKRTHRVLVGKEIFSFQVAWKLHHVASPVVETVRTGERKRICAIPANCSLLDHGVASAARE
jgi:hypothetical protein